MHGAPQQNKQRSKLATDNGKNECNFLSPHFLQQIGNGCTATLHAAAKRSIEFVENDFGRAPRTVKVNS
jgi:hypothetical protein